MSNLPDFLPDYNNQKIGAFGERIACAYLLKNGWKTIARNHRERSDEIDIIAFSPDKTLVFLEVKTRRLTSRAPGIQAEDNLTPHKLHKLSRACLIFAEKHQNLINDEQGWRIDLLAIDIGIRGDILDIRHYKNI